MLIYFNPSPVHVKHQTHSPGSCPSKYTSDNVPILATPSSETANATHMTGRMQLIRDCTLPLLGHLYGVVRVERLSWVPCDSRYKLDLPNLTLLGSPP